MKRKYCAPLTKQELQEAGIDSVYNWFGNWIIYRRWYKTNSKTKELTKINITTVSLNHKKSGQKKVYNKVNFCVKQKVYSIPLARFLYVWFKEDITEPGLVVDHIDNDPFNDTLDNLQLITIGENNRKRFTDNPNCNVNQYGPKKKNNEQIQLRKDTDNRRV